MIRVDGEVKARTAGDGQPEPADRRRSRSSPREIEVLSAAAELPLPVFGDLDYPEETRLKYRFLDLRRDKLHQNVMKRGGDHLLAPPAHDATPASSSSRRRS